MSEVNDNLLLQIEAARSKALDRLLDAEDKESSARLEVIACTREFERLNRGYKALTGDDYPADNRVIGTSGERLDVSPPALVAVPTSIPRVAEKRPQEPQRPVAPEGAPRPLRPLCSGCGEPTLEMAEIVLQSGKIVRTLKCIDSQCGNEQY